MTKKRESLGLLKKWFKGDIFMYFCFAMMILALISGGCQYLNNKAGLEDDHAIEEAVEKKIEDVTGLDVDLTPESPE